MQATYKAIIHTSSRFHPRFIFFWTRLWRLYTTKYLESRIRYSSVARMIFNRHSYVSTPIARSRKERILSKFPLYYLNTMHSHILQSPRSTDSTLLESRAKDHQRDPRRDSDRRRTSGRDEDDETSSTALRVSENVESSAMLGV